MFVTRKLMYGVRILLTSMPQVIRPYSLVLRPALMCLEVRFKKFDIEDIIIEYDLMVWLEAIELETFSF